MVSLISVAEATVPPIPKGIFSTPAAETNGYPNQILNDTRIVGLDIGGLWQNLEPTEGVYDWSSADSQLAQAAAHGKKVLLGITSGGLIIQPYKPSHLIITERKLPYLFSGIRPFWLRK
jgi:hypothetical protein